MARDRERDLAAEAAQQAKAKDALHEIWMAECRVDAEQAFDYFLSTYEAKAKRRRRFGFSWNFEAGRSKAASRYARLHTPK